MMSCVAGISIGIYEKALPSGVDWFARLTMAAQAGFDFVEMSLDPSRERLERLTWSQARRREVRHMIEDAGIPILTMCLSANRSCPLGSGDVGVRRRGLEVVRQAVDLAADLGIRIVQLAGYDRLPDEAPDGRNGARYVEAVRQAAVWASERAVLLGLENQEHGYIDSPTTAVRVIREVDSPYLRLYMDIGNIVVNGLDVEAEITAARGNLVGVHVKDARPGVPRRVPFGEGAVPFAAVFHRLAGIGFSGPVMIEMWNDDRPDALDVAAAARDWIEAQLLEGGFPVRSDELK